ncbi:MAG: flagellar filament capping protein FliD, partial [Hylemonella sp.]|nr:flagellar filament capping protein FliD [Hylemonella sp.]
TATVLNDASGERLLLRSNSTGEAAGFRVQVTGDSDGNDANSQGLSRLAFDPQTGVFGMADNSYQKAQNTLATINNVPVTSGTNKLADAVPGLTLEFNEVTTSAVEIGIATDQAAIRKNIQDFMAAYNTLSRTLSDATKYDAETKTAGAMQGDSIVVGLQNVLRNVLGSSSVGGSFSRLAEAGIEMQRGGVLTLAPAKFDAAMKDPANLKQLFASDNGNAQTNGFGLKVSDFARGLLAAGGTVSNKTSALERELQRNSREQEKVNDRVVRVEQRLRQQYSALDARMGSLTALSAYISQQVTLWNKIK